MKPAIFGSDVVDLVNMVVAEHINNLRAWTSMFMPLICNMETITTTDTSYVLSDTDKPFQLFSAVGSTDFKVYLPDASTDNHPFWIANGTTDKTQYHIMVLNSSSDQMGSVLIDPYSLYRVWLPTGTEWLCPS